MESQACYDHERFDRLLDRGQLRAARDAVRSSLRKEPEDPLLWMELAETYYGENKYKLALRYYEKAYRLAPSSPLVLSDYAGTLDLMGREKEAIEIWKKLLRKGRNRIARGEHIAGMRDASCLLNQCRFRLALSHARLGSIASAIRYLKRHIANRARGLPSDCSLQDAKRMLKNLERRR